MLIFSSSSLVDGLVTCWYVTILWYRITIRGEKVRVRVMCVRGAKTIHIWTPSVDQKI